MAERRAVLAALAGQQNAGKSTLFNMLTGARQHVANYPGVTVDKKYGRYQDGDLRVLTVDLPGTYSLTSFSLEERVARDFLLKEKPDVVVDVVDAASLHRSLHLTLQLLEMDQPVLLALNMIDVIERRGMRIDEALLSERLGLPVVPTVGRKGRGRAELRRAIRDYQRGSRHRPVEYGPLESDIEALTQQLSSIPELRGYPPRWLALRLLEGDEQVRKILAGLDDRSAASRISEMTAATRAAFAERHQAELTDHIMTCRDQAVTRLLDGVITEARTERATLSERVDNLVLNRFLAPFFLILTVYLIYQVSIVYGYELTTYTWPILAGLREIIAGWLPAAGFLVDPYVRALGLWLVDSANTLLNYVPIFLILFALIAILEDSGYMARIAFILDRILHRFGLHGQSTLPMILSGVFAGGCAVPGVMATKGIPDNRARMATILTVPYMNCLAKVPLYTLLLGIFFVEDKSLMMFYISTMTIIFALLVAKLLTITVLRGQETAPFVMELPRYHAPAPGAVLRRAFDRTWIYIKKVGTIVLAVAIVVFALLHFPGLSDDRKAHYEAEAQAALIQFQEAMAGNKYLEFASGDQLVPLLNFADDYRRARLNASGAEGVQAVDRRFEARSPDYFVFVRPPPGDLDARQASRALRDLGRERTTLRREMREERIVDSLLGQVGRGLEPVTQFAGFDWKINVALLASFAARESSVATLGVLFQQDADSNVPLEQRMGTETQAAGATALLAVSMILFFALYPPCLATTIMVKVQTDSYRWMLFSIVFPTALGLGVASAVYTIGHAIDVTGIQMMTIVYFTALALLLIIGLTGSRRDRSAHRRGALPLGARSSE
ncbi:ferrous iron transport protein B [Thioalkalicoccus limnaeus]|uniref:Ferrous iron transport protein B n=1 Tax=Thioalkalicoccus limnaeus TaxID=120681 RepID=A0ABV4BEM0_9GAMM